MCAGCSCSLSDSAGNFTRTQAAGAGVDITGRTVNHSFHSFYVGLPSSVCTSVRVGHLDTKGHAFPTAITFAIYCTSSFKSLEYNIK